MGLQAALVTAAYLLSVATAGLYIAGGGAPRM